MVFVFTKKCCKENFAKAVAKRVWARGQLVMFTVEMSLSCGWPEELAAAWPDLDIITLSEVFCVSVCSKVTILSCLRFFIPFLFPSAVKWPLWSTS